MSSTDPASCTECNYPVGKVDEPSICVDEAYSSSRVVPPYSSSAKSVDWRDWGIVNRVRNQGSCGSCYCFATAGAAEISYAIKTGIRYNLSE